MDQTFTLFGALPAELRLQIWRQSCQPRVVEVRYSEDDDRCYSTTKPPAILQVCTEARDECSRHYVKAFGTESYEGNIYFLPTLDILYLPRCGDMGYGDTARDFSQYVLDTVEHVHSLAIDHVKPEIRRPWETYNKFCLMRNFPDLNETFLILGSGPDDRDDDRDGQIEFVDPRGDPLAIMRLMENVKESFIYEVGPTSFFESEKSAESGNEPSLALIPKTKTTQPS
ncbi:hypothetical protein B0T19DRAFT_444011 [Cercophora scortea]|uniref:2EXR domain-containing protein n=1 Tax=Cercophora scortea TaxID=314031 RepID=A0AAE0MAJ3_9PEZI|nr:hypothetical protein B0T19DRAFT_444011 [Cercophora scortea]